MRFRDLLIHVLLVGWLAALTALGMPVFLLAVDRQYQVHSIVFVWLTGSVISLLCGIIVLLGKTQHTKVAQFFVLVGLLSLGGMYWAHLKYGYDFRSESVIMGTPQSAGTGGR